MENLTQVINEVQARRLLRSCVVNLSCPRCSRVRYVRKVSDGRWHCTKCRYKFSLKILLGFKYSKLSYLQMVRLIFCFSKKYPLLHALGVTGLSVVSLRRNYMDIRKRLPQLKEKLFGDIVVDECFLEKRKTGNQVIIGGGVDRNGEYIRLQPLRNREMESLERMILENVEPGSLITTDAHASYFELEWDGYGHQVDNHSKGELSRSVPIERIWSQFKNLIRRTYHHIRREHLRDYLLEFQSRYNYRNIVSNPLKLLQYFASSVPRG